MRESFSGLVIRRGEKGFGKAFEFAEIAFRNLPFLEEFHFFELVDSTNERAKSARPFSLLFAEEQTSGRGRRERSWVSKKGGLYFSIVLPGYNVSKLTLISALSVAEAVKDSKIKWPNDVLLFGKKFCGILGEAFEDKAIVGIGINVENDVSEFEFACNIKSYYPLSIKDVFENVMKNFAKNYTELLAGKWREIFERFAKICETRGKRVKVITPGRVIEGVAELSEDGAIVVNGEKIYSGDCIHLR
ncbi:MAG: biotin--[acetyl-CoA-carboxylase] ligase [Archaeoglobaceae archaeon]